MVGGGSGARCTFVGRAVGREGERQSVGEGVKGRAGEWGEGVEGRLCPLLVEP